MPRPSCKTRLSKPLGDVNETVDGRTVISVRLLTVWMCRLVAILNNVSTSSGPSLKAPAVEPIGGIPEHPADPASFVGAANLRANLRGIVAASGLPGVVIEILQPRTNQGPLPFHFCHGPSHCFIDRALRLPDNRRKAQQSRKSSGKRGRIDHGTNEIYIRRQVLQCLSNTKVTVVPRRVTEGVDSEECPMPMHCRAGTPEELGDGAYSRLGRHTFRISRGGNAAA